MCLIRSIDEHKCKNISFTRYTYDKNYGNALEIYLTLRHKDVFQLIHKHNLFSSIKDKIVLLMDFDSEVMCFSDLILIIYFYCSKFLATRHLSKC